MDDGGGLFTTWESLKLLTDLVTSGLIPRPRRTIRLVLWVDEEISQRGAQTYVEDHLSEMPNHVLATESDSGNFQVTGFGFTGNEEAEKILQQIGSILLSPIGAGNITYGNGAGTDADNGYMQPYCVPLASLYSSGFNEQLPIDDIYFYYHHTNADMFNILNPDGLRNSVGALGVLSYVIADMEQTLPRRSCSSEK